MINIPDIEYSAFFEAEAITNITSFLKKIDYNNIKISYFVNILSYISFYVLSILMHFSNSMIELFDFLFVEKHIYLSLYVFY